MLLSEARHPEARPMTIVAVVKTWLDNLVPGENIFPQVVDDIKRKGPVPVANLRAELNRFKSDKVLVTRVVGEDLIVYWITGE